MAVDTAKTVSTLSTVSTAIKNRYYDELFLRIAQSKLVHQQLGQLDRQIPQGAGGYGTGAVYWTRWSNLPLVTAGQGEGVPTTAVSMTAANITGSVAQYDAAVSISDIVAYTAFGDVMKAAMTRLAYNAGLSIDTVIANVISTAGTLQSATGVTGANWTSIPATGTLNISEIRRAKRTLERNDAQQLPDGSWAAVIHPDVLYDLEADTSTGGWIDANKYTAPNAEDALLKGEVGKLLGVRFLQSTNAYRRGAGIATSGTVYVTSVFGQDAFGVTKLQNLKTYVKDFGTGGTGDPTEKVATAGWKTTFGVAPLNSNFFVNISSAVSAT